MKTQVALFFLVITTFAFGDGPTALADVKLPAIFSDHMLLQRDATVPVWGWAEPGEEVVISLAGQTKATQASADGKWAVRLDKLAVGGAFTLTVKGKNTLAVSDVLVGELWLCSGQSNMHLPVSRANNAQQEQAAANWPQIRMFSVDPNRQPEPQADCKGQWEVCSPATVGGFSATAYFFGRELHQKLAVPVGLIRSCVGGTPIESWISAEAQRNSPELKAFFALREKGEQAFDAAAVRAKSEKALAKWKEAVANGGELKGFMVAGDDNRWMGAKARIDGQQVVVSSPDVKRPVAVRYAWADNPDCNLYNGAGLPASPFRTDDWP